MPVASGSTYVAPAAVTTASSINLPEGRTLNVNVKRGENDPAKKHLQNPKEGIIKQVTGRKVALTVTQYHNHMTCIGSMFLIDAKTDQFLTKQDLRIA